MATSDGESPTEATEATEAATTTAAEPGRQATSRAGDGGNGTGSASGPSDPPGREGIATHRATLSELPTSAKLVATVLAHEGRLTGTELADESRLPARTVRYAVRRLEGAGVVASGPGIRDARTKVYWLEG